MNLEDIFRTPAWQIESVRKYHHPKCDLCDSDRIRHFTSPCGRAMEELCWCAESDPWYQPRPVSISTLSVRKGDPPVFSYKVSTEIPHIESSWASAYSGESFSYELLRTNVLFFNLSDAQRFCDWLNRFWKDSDITSSNERA